MTEGHTQRRERTDHKAPCVKKLEKQANISPISVCLHAHSTPACRVFQEKPSCAVSASDDTVFHLPLMVKNAPGPKSFTCMLL